MKRYAFPLTIILLLSAVIALAAPGDKHPAVTSAAIGLGTSSSPTLASITATTSVTAPAYNSTAADGYHYILPYNSTAFAGTPLAGMFVTTPTGPQWYNGSEWEAIGSGGGGTWGSITGTLSAQTDLQAALDAISAGGITISTGTPTTAGAAYLNDSTHVLTVASATGYTQFTGSYTAWDTTPAAFAFTDVTDAALSTVQTATPVQITSINYPTAVTATGGTAAICTGATVGTCGTFSASPGNVALNQYVSAQHTSSGSNSTAVDTVVTVGGVSDTFTSTTVAGAATVAYDHFTDTDSVPIDSHTADSGHSWTKVGSSTMAINTNHAVATASGNPGFYYSSYSPPDGDYTVKASVVVANTSNVSPAVAGRISTSGETGYFAYWTNGSWTLFKTVSGTRTQLGAYAGYVPTTAKVVSLAMTGTTINVDVEGVNVISVTDSSISTGRAGVGAYYADTTTSKYIDDWEVWD